MLTKLHLLLAFRADRRGVTALEYAIIAGVLGTVLVTAFTSFGTALSGVFTTITSKL